MSLGEPPASQGRPEAEPEPLECRRPDQVHCVVGIVGHVEAVEIVGIDGVPVDELTAK